MRKNLLITLVLSIAFASVVFAGTTIATKNYNYKSPQAGTYNNPQMKTFGMYGNQPPMVPYGNMYGNRPPMPPQGSMYGNRPPMMPYGNMYGNRPPMPPQNGMYGNRPPMMYGNMYGNKAPQQKSNKNKINYPVTIPLYDESRPVVQ